jgi:hypothetical protein
MWKSQPAYLTKFWRQMVELVRAGVPRASRDGLHTKYALDPMFAV